jgi:acyl carrier protein
MTMKTPVTLESIQELVGRQIGRRGVKADDQLVADLGIESIDILNLANTVEEKFNLSLRDEEISGLRTVRDIHGLVERKVAAS